MKRGGFFFELGRRRVWRVAGAYVLGVWMALEILLETAPVLGFPGWVSRVAVVAAIVGFPVTMVLSWIFDLTPAGVVRTPALRRKDDEAGELPAEPGPVVLAGPGPARLAGVFGAGILVALVGLGAYSMVQPARVLRGAEIEAVAVLPFTDLSAGGDQGYLADGVAEELINRLARAGDLRVAARSSSFAFRGDPRLDEVVRQLGVDAVVEGSVRRDGDRVRITAQLVDAGTGFQIWSETYHRDADDIFAIQDEIAASIAAALRVQLAPAASGLRAGTDNVRAHDAYLLGLARWHARTEADLERALEYFRAAVEEDETYAPAHAGLALTYAVLPAYTDIPADVAAERGAEAAARALALDAHNAEAHAAIGQIAQSLEWNLDAAEMAYRRALEFQPSYATGHQWYAETLMIGGRLEEARREVDHALAIDPLSLTGRATRAYLQTVRHEYADALAGYRRLLEEAPAFTLAHAGRLYLCLAADCHEDAERSARELPGGALLLEVVAADRDPARRPDGLRALTGLEAAGSLPAGQLALLYAAMGDRAGAIRQVRRAYDEGVDPSFPLYLVHPLFDTLRRDPAFMEVADALGAEAPAAGLARAYIPAGALDSSAATARGTAGAPSGL